VLVSCEEQWGLVVNEALAVGLPVIASGQVGSCDALVRNLVNGFVVESGSAEAIGRAMYEMAADAGQWQDMAKASRARAWLGDAERLADAIELLLFPGAEPAGERCRAMLGEMDR
jgi:glycosyltransferase involved in cell wall biosynthesis